MAAFAKSMKDKIVVPATKFLPFIFLLAVYFLPVACFQHKKETPAAPTLTDTIPANRPRLSEVKPNTSVPDSSKKKIYLTFDDGPNAGTLNVLRAVKEDSIPVSFFIVGKHAADSKKQAAAWQQLKADSLIELCNHSYSHALNRYTRYYRHPDRVVNDIQRNQQQLGFTNNLIRMPGRNAWRIDSIDHTDIKESIPAIDAVHRAGFAIIGWDLEWLFDHTSLSLATDPGLLLRQIRNRLESGTTMIPGHLVLLAHDQAFQSAAAIEQLHYFFRQLKKIPEYELVFASSYPGVKK